MAGHSRDHAREVVTAWLADPNARIDAICANDDELAMGAIDALAEAGRLDGVAVGGVDGMADALDAMVAGQLAVTVFEDAAGQGSDAIETAATSWPGPVGRHRGGSILLPGELVTPDNVNEYLGRNVPPVAGGDAAAGGRGPFALGGAGLLGLLALSGACTGWWSRSAWATCRR